MNQIIYYIGWAFLPNLVTSWIQWLYYRIITRAGEPMPQPGTRKHAHDNRIINIAVIGLYLLYTIYEADYQLRLTPNFYEMMGVPFDVDAKTLKSRWRKLTIKFHPDKAGPSSADYFVALRLCYETLTDPTKRFAYDRFGPTILEWHTCSTIQDYIGKGILNLFPYYFISLIFLIILSALGKLEFGRFWRFFSLFALLIFEGLVISRTHNLFMFIPSLFNSVKSKLMSVSFLPPIFLVKINNLTINNIPLLHPTLPFEHLQLARKITVAFFLAISQLGPLLASSGTSPKTAQELAAALKPQMQRLEAIAKLLETQAASGPATEFMPFQGDEGAVKVLERKLGKYLVETQLRGDPLVRDAIGRVIKGRRQGVPVGARGNR